MFHYLENLRKKPEYERRKALVIISLSITIVIGVIWAVLLFIRIKHTDFSLKSEAVESGKTTIKGSLEKFISNFSNAPKSGDEIINTDSQQTQ
jgi:hypothetical protein